MPPAFRRLSILATLWLLVLSVPSRNASAQDSDALALLKRAATQSNIRTAEHSPFRLEARVRLLDGPFVEADYSLLWVSAGQWREEITVGSEYSVRIGVGDRVWTDDEGQDAYRVRRIMSNLDMPVLLLPRPTEFVTPIASLEHGGVQLQCVYVRNDSSQWQYCVDPQQGLLRAYEGNAGSSWTEYVDYEDFEGVAFPRLVKCYAHDNVTIEVIVKRLVREAGVSPGAFTPSEDAVVKPGCEHPEPPIPLFSHPESVLDLPRHTGAVTLMATIDTQGRVDDIKVVEPFGNYNNHAIDTARSKNFRPATCNNVPVPFDARFTVYIVKR